MAMQNRLQLKKPRLLALFSSSSFADALFNFKKKKKKKGNFAGVDDVCSFFLLSLFLEWRNLPHPFSPTTTTTRRVYFCFPLQKSFRLDSISVAFYNTLHFSRCACDLFVCLFFFFISFISKKNKTFDDERFRACSMSITKMRECFVFSLKLYNAAVTVKKLYGKLVFIFIEFDPPRSISFEFYVLCVFFLFFCFCFF